VTVAAIPDEQASAANLMAVVRARAAVAVAFRARPDGITYPLTVTETGGYRARFPRGGAPGVPEAVLINTGGGMAGGDQVAFDISLEASASAVVTTQAAERIYRSLGHDTRITTTLSCAPSARLAWLPQETILYDRGRLRRRIDVDMAADATLLLSEIFVFGRTAMGERIRDGALDDRWQIRRGGELVLVEAVRLSGDIAATLDRAAVGAGARAMATAVLVAPDATDRLEAARSLFSADDVGAVSAWNGLLCARFLGEDARRVRSAVGRFAAWAWRGALPRVWAS
jgi:urease accessory protein